jgi:hypothetical protein
MKTYRQCCILRQNQHKHRHSEQAEGEVKNPGTVNKRYSGFPGFFADAQNDGNLAIC